MKFRTFITPLAVVAGLGFIVGLAFLGGLLLRNPLALIEQGGVQTPAALQFIPKQSTLVASFLARPDRFTDVWEYLTEPGLRQSTRQDIEQIESTLLAGTGLDYDQNILPWLGEEITAAIVSSDLDQNPGNGQTKGYLLALACKDSQAAKATLELFWQNRAIAGDALTFEDFAGNRLIYSRHQTTETSSKPLKPTGQLPFEQLATTIVANQFVLVANHPEVLRLALNAAQSSDNNLAADQRYRSALKALPQKRVGLLAFSLPALAQTFNRDAAAPTYSQPLKTLGQAGDFVDWGLLSFGLDRAGVIGDVALAAAPGHRLTPHQPKLKDIPQVATFLPEQATISAVGLDLHSLWESIQPLWQYYAGGTSPLEFASNDVSNMLNADLASELLDTFVNEFALSLGPGIGTDWLLMTQDNTALNQTLDLLKAEAQKAGLGANPLVVQGQPTTALARLVLNSDATFNQRQGLVVTAQVVGLHTQVDDVALMASSPVAMNAALKRWRSQQGIPGWAQQLSVFQRPNEGYIHINWPELQSGLSQKISRFRLWETAAKPVLKHLKQITLTSYGRTQKLQQGRIFFQLSNQ